MAMPDTTQLELSGSGSSDNGDALSDGQSCICQPKKSKIKQDTLFPSVMVGYRDQRPMGVGLFNMGNTCYISATLQALFHIPSVYNFLLSHDKQTRCLCKDSSCIICSLTLTLRDSLLLSCVKPTQIIEKLESICKDFELGNQEDAHEFLRHLTDYCDRSFIASKGTNDVERLTNDETVATPFTQIFSGTMRQKVQCGKCRHITTTWQTFMEILLNILDVSSINDALNLNFVDEMIGSDDNGNLYVCHKCGENVSATRKVMIERPPAVLCFPIGRFNSNHGKISKKICLSKKLDIAPFVVDNVLDSEENVLEYEFVSAIIHIGYSMKCGHYTAIVDSGNGQFVQFDDSKTSPVPEIELSNSSAYVVFYEMKRSMWEKLSRKVVETSTETTCDPIVTDDRKSPAVVTSLFRMTNRWMNKRA